MPQRGGPPGADQAARVRGVRHAVHARNPLGATMVSSEGACAAYYLYRRLSIPTQPPAAPRRTGAAARSEEVSSVG